MTGRVFVIELQPGTPVLTANTNNRLSRHAKAARVKDLRRLGYQLAGRHRLPRLGLSDVLLEYQPPPRRRADRHPFASERVEDGDALAPTLKHLVDGIADAAVFPVDSRKHVRESACRLLPGTHPRGLVRLTITEVGSA